MEAEIQLGKLDCPGLRELLEESSFRLKDSRHMMDMIPLLLQEEHTRVRGAGREDVSIIVDSTTRLGEVLVLIVHFLMCGLFCSIL